MTDGIAVVAQWGCGGFSAFWGWIGVEMHLALLALSLAAIDMPGLIKGLIYLLIAALIVGVVCYIVVRLASQFMPGFAPYAWIVYVIGGLVLLLIALNVFGPVLGI